jgi:hypothetical protein
MTSIRVAPLIGRQVIAAAAETKLVHLKLPRQDGTCRENALKILRIMMVVHCYTTTSFVKKSGDGNAESLLFLTPFIPLAVSFVFVMSLMCSLESL